MLTVFLLVHIEAAFGVLTVLLLVHMEAAFSVLTTCSMLAVSI